MSQIKAFEIAPRVSGNDSTRPVPHIGEEDYEREYPRSIGENRLEFWAEQARITLDWFHSFKTIASGGFDKGDVAWFLEGELNAAYNTVDRWAFERPDDVAIIWEADEPGNERKITYRELLCEVCQVAGTLREYGVRKGDTVLIYLPMVPQAAISMLACARIGAVHAVVFAGFSADSLHDRINDSQARVLITSDEGRRGGRTIATKSIVEAALADCPLIEHVLVVQRTGNPEIPWVEGRDKWLHEEMAKQRTYLPPVNVNSEDPLFVLYTSGSTGKPKGIVHSTAGYLLGAALTTKHVFDLHRGDRFGCMADIGWITGHSYVVYGPLMNGVATLIFESTPVYPTASRYWDTVDKFQLTQFYTAPTSIRLLRRLGDDYVKSHHLSSLRVLGSVGEPINPDAWHWYNDHVGRGQCAIVDTYWMTEGGSHMVSALPGAIRTKPGSATLPFWGIDVTILDQHSGKEVTEPDVEGALVVKKPWPSMARTISKDHKRFMETYLKVYPGYFFTGDSATRDSDGYVWIKGRVDDVINVSGHRMSTAEIESALASYPGVGESAAVGAPDETTGQSITAFVVLKPEFMCDSEEALAKELVIQVRRAIGPFATPKRIVCVRDLPKTRSGKIMRRVLRKIVYGETDQLGDLSSIMDPTIVDHIKVCVLSN